ncbi:uncharacterized membrane protein At1g16860 [Magnolia sinica]|uniref:uncharacterized membrane protein At1g16860 n=1 Tax=Magnolia sinica TaxID=86752 RepID=UPI00265857A0|nr:uncharacterized membrane protein At1g16860 [Magnolia sinica]
MGTRIPSHQLSNGLIVSGRPEQYKERPPTMASRAVPYTGGDVKKSGELGKMFDIPVVDPSKSRPSSSSQHNSGSIRSASNSGPIPPKPSNSGPLPKKSSGPLPLHPTGLITSGPIGSSASGGGGARRSGQLEPSASMGKPYGPAVTSLGEKAKFGFKISKPIMWVSVVVFAIGLMAGVFMMVTVKKAVILVVVGGILVPVVVLIGWNYAWGRRGVQRYLRKYPDAELRGAADGQCVKVTGVVTCGSIPLESSFQRVPRCVYVSTELHEYRGWGGKSANSNHRRCSWGLRHSERHVADFYISDFQSGLRALVKAGYGAKVAPFVKPATVVDITAENRELSPSFLHWLAERNLSSDDRIMRLEEGYIKEGSTVSVMGIVQRHDNVLMIVPSAEPVSTGCQWLSCLLPAYIEGLVLMCDESQSADVIPV